MPWGEVWELIGGLSSRSRIQQALSADARRGGGRTPRPQAATVPRDPDPSRFDSVRAARGLSALGRGRVHDLREG